LGLPTNKTGSLEAKMGLLGTSFGCENGPANPTAGLPLCSCNLSARVPGRMQTQRLYPKWLGTSPPSPQWAVKLVPACCFLQSNRTMQVRVDLFPFWSGLGREFACEPHHIFLLEDHRVCINSPSFSLRVLGLKHICVAAPREGRYGSHCLRKRPSLGGILAQSPRQSTPLRRVQRSDRSDQGPTSPRGSGEALPETLEARPNPEVARAVAALKTEKRRWSVMAWFSTPEN
jgi:hypothetical protein